MKALFIDFEDSFTFNVVQELTEVGVQVEVIHWHDFKEPTSDDLLVLGPGPGHPDDYQVIYPLIQEWLDSGKKLFAVCLGHQILWRIYGAKVERSVHPLHGQKVLLPLSHDWKEWLGVSGEVWVQRYNSLAVKSPVTSKGYELFEMDGEVTMSRSSHVISYQFHPESMGTNCRQAFFNPVARDLL